MLGGITSFSLKCPNSLVDQSLFRKASSSMSGYVASNTNSALWCFFKYPKICNTCSRLPTRGSAKHDDINEHSRQMSTLPNSTIQRSTPISDMYHEASFVPNSGVASNSGLYKVRMGVFTLAGILNRLSPARTLSDRNFSTFLTAC